MQQSQSQSVSIFATEKVDKAYVEKDKMVIQALSSNLVKFMSKHKAEQTSNKHNLQTKLVEFTSKPGTVFRIPGVDQVRQNFKDTLQCFCFIQSAKDPFQFFLILQFFNYYSQAAVTTLVNNFKYDLIKSSIQEVTLKGKQTNNKSIKQLVNDITLNNINLQHLVFYNFEQQEEESKEVVLTDKLSQFNHEFTKAYTETFKAICSFPLNYPQCQLFNLHQKDFDDLVYYLRHNLVATVKLSVMVTSYDIALEYMKTTFNEEFLDFQSQFEEQLHKQTLMNQIVESNTSLTEYFLRSIFSRLKQGNAAPKVIHPHPMASFATHYQNYMKDGVFELLCYDPEYIIQILTVSRWFAKVILQDEKVVAHDNNNCALFLYGTEGTGKSRIAKAFKDAFMAYNWFKGEYQSPEIVNGSCFYAEEVEFNYLISPLMKNVLDFEASERVNIKNMHPVECSYMTPVILTSNQYPQEIFQQHMQANQKSKQSSAAGLMRRLFCVQFSQKFDDKYKNLEPSDDVYRSLQKMFLSSTKEQLFNTIYGLALMQADLKNIIAPAHLYNYHTYVLESILQTHFGIFYHRNKKTIDQIITDYIQFANKYETPQQQVNQNIDSLKLTLRDLQQMYMTDTIVNSNNSRGLLDIYRSAEKIHLRILRVLTQVPIIERISKMSMTNNHYQQWEANAMEENEMNVLLSEEFLDDPGFDIIHEELERIHSTYCKPSSQPANQQNKLLGKRTKVFETDLKIKKRFAPDEDFFDNMPRPVFNFEDLDILNTGNDNMGLRLEDLDPVKMNLNDKFDQ